MFRVYVGNLDPGVTVRELEDVFSSYVISDVSMRSSGYAFVDFDDRRNALDAIRDLDGKKGWRVEMFSEDRIRKRGVDDLQVMEGAPTDFKTKFSEGFRHVEAHNSVQRHDDWLGNMLLEVDSEGRFYKRQRSAESGHFTSSSDDSIDSQIPNLNDNITPAHKRQRSAESGHLTSSSDDSIDSQIPNLNDYITSARPTQGKKKTESSSKGTVPDTISSLTARKEELFMKMVERQLLKDDDSIKLIAEQRQLVAAQMERLKQKTYDRDLKAFVEPHDKIVDTFMLELVLNRKKEIAKKYGWPVNF